jgi:alkylation response protein AidB-like acyl-CoA dehydrogenase
MRQRAGTQPVTLEPSRVIEILALARDHDDRLKALQQDLLRAETKLRVERKWKWPVRAGCVGLGVAGVFVAQNEALMSYLGASLTTIWNELQAKANASLFILIVAGLAIYGVVWAIRRSLREPTPEQQARKLMQQFAEKDGVAAYVFSNDSAEEDAASITALTKPENDKLRQRHFTSSHRTLQSSMNRLLHRIDDDTLQVLH